MRAGDALAEVAASRAIDPLRPVTVVAPSRLATLALRRELARLTPHAAVRFETLPRLAELIGSGALAMEGRRPLARPIGDYAAAVVARQSGGSLVRVAGLPGYARVLRRHFQRLRRGGIRSSRELEEAPDSESTREFLRAYDAFRDLTHPFYDDEDLFDAAASAIASGRGGVAEELGELYVVPPAVRTAGGDGLVRAMARGGLPVRDLEEDAPAVTPSFVLTPDPASECDAATRRVVELLEAGAGLHEVAVFHGADRSYPAMLEGAFARAGVPSVRFPGRPLNETPAGRAVQTLLELPAQDYSRVAVMDFFALSQSPWRVPGAVGQEVPLRPTTWDRITREAGVTHGQERWGVALAAAAADLRERARDIDDGAWQARIEADAAMAEALSGLVAELIERLEPLRREQPAGPFIAALKSVTGVYVREDSAGFAEVMEEIDQLGTVAALGGTFRLESFIAAFDANLRAAAVRERGLGDGVLVADFRAAAGLRYRHVVVCGAHEGAFPAGASIAPVVDESWWSAVRARHPFVESAEVRIERERAAALRCLASASESLTIALSTAAEGGTRERYPAPVVAAMASERLGERVTPASLRNGRHRGVERVRSTLAAAASGAVLDRFEHEVREAIGLRRTAPGGVPAGHRLERPVALRRMRRAGRLSEWDGLVQAGIQLLPAERQLSATSIEDYATCGFRFFLSSVLRVRALDEPEERQTMDPALRGTIVHRTLERFFTGQRERRRPAALEAWGSEDERELIGIVEDEVAKAQARGQTGLSIFHAHEQAALRADLVRFLKEDSLYRASAGALPESFEWKFNGVQIAGRLFRGAADRVDVSQDGRQAWIIDYKTGGTTGYTDQPGDPFRGGSRLQLGIYAAAMAAGNGDLDITGRYWFITQKGEFAAVEYRHTPENAARLTEIIQAIEAGVSSGAFPAVPGDEDRESFANCRYCDFDRICSRRRLADYTNRAGGDSMLPWARVQETARGAGDA